MSRWTTLLILGLLLVSALVATSASAYEPAPPPWLEEFEEHPPGLPSPPPSEPTEASADEVPPDTSIDGSATSLGGRWRKFLFVSTEQGSSFVCRFDAREAFACGSPLVLRHLGPGPHTVAVAAVDPAGNVDPTPATYHFRVTIR
jgi:hypothetical protein